MSLYSILYKAEQLKAAQAVLEDTNDFFYRKVCRWYSKTFSTELTKVYDMPFHFILQQYYEEKLSEKDYNETFQYVTDNLLGEFIKKKEMEDQAFMESLLKEQAERSARKKIKQQEENKEPKIPAINLSFEENGEEEVDWKKHWSVSF